MLNISCQHIPMVHLCHSYPWELETKGENYAKHKNLQNSMGDPCKTNHNSSSSFQNRYQIVLHLSLQRIQLWALLQPSSQPSPSIESQFFHKFAHLMTNRYLHPLFLFSMRFIWTVKRYALWDFGQREHLMTASKEFEISLAEPSYYSCQKHK